MCGGSGERRRAFPTPQGPTSLIPFYGVEHLTPISSWRRRYLSASPTFKTTDCEYSIVVFSTVKNGRHSISAITLRRLCLSVFVTLVRIRVRNSDFFSSDLISEMLSTKARFCLFPYLHKTHLKSSSPRRRRDVNNQRRRMQIPAVDLSLSHTSAGLLAEPSSGIVSHEGHPAPSARRKPLRTPPTLSVSRTSVQLSRWHYVLFAD